jgi:hypothetical protein
MVTLFGLGDQMTAYRSKLTELEGLKMSPFESKAD